MEGEGAAYNQGGAVIGLDYGGRGGLWIDEGEEQGE